LAQINYNL